MSHPIVAEVRRELADVPPAIRAAMVAALFGFIAEELTAGRINDAEQVARLAAAILVALPDAPR